MKFLFSSIQKFHSIRVCLCIYIHDMQTHMRPKVEQGRPTVLCPSVHTMKGKSSDADFVDVEKVSWVRSGKDGKGLCVHFLVCWWDVWGHVGRLSFRVRA